MLTELLLETTASHVLNGLALTGGQALRWTCSRTFPHSSFHPPILHFVSGQAPFISLLTDEVVSEFLSLVDLLLRSLSFYHSIIEAGFTQRTQL
jgi:hypothetical protein